MTKSVKNTVKPQASVYAKRQEQFAALALSKMFARVSLPLKTV